ncbi:MAG: ATP-binding protein [Candidatus Helarchaeota archaeon]
MYNLKAAELVQHLEVMPKTVRLGKLAKKLGCTRKELKAILDPLAEKFFIVKMGGYSIPTPLMIFDAPFILDRNLTQSNIKDFAKLSRTFFEKEGYYKSWETSYKGTPRTRILTVSEKIEPTHDIVPIEEVYHIIDNASSFALVECPCRKRAEVEGIRKCEDKYPIRNCVILGPTADALLELGDPGTRRVTKEEVKEIAREAAELGLVHTTDNYAGPSSILCECCECCCGLLAGITRPGLNNPKAIAKANYFASIDVTKCKACGTCETRCKFNAITLEDIAVVNKDRCMGCGLCAVTCPEDAITMQRLERELIPGSQQRKHN